MDSSIDIFVYKNKKKRVIEKQKEAGVKTGIILA